MNQELSNLSKEELIKLRNDTEKTKWEYYNKFNKLTNQTKYLESIIYKKCDHEWEYDYTASGPYDGPDKICKYCKLYNNRYMYQMH
jgi:MoaA/NifB/PqqE/SkfB family radical SAM enzyme